MKRLSLALCLVSFTLPALHSQIALPSLTASPAAKNSNPDPLGRDTPHGAVLGFLRSAQSGDLVVASQYLDTDVKGAEGQDLARKLKAVLDHDLITNLDAISSNPEGSLTDNLPPDQESIGNITSDHQKIPVLLHRVSRQNRLVWLFAPTLLDQVPDLFDDIDRPAIEQHLPDFLLVRLHILSLRLWQILAFGLAIVFAFFIAAFATHALVFLLRPLVERISRERAASRLESIAGPVRFLMLVLVMRAGTTILTLPILVRQYWIRIVAVLAVGGATWLVSRIIEISSQLSANRFVRIREPGSLAIVHLVRRLLKAAAVLIGFLLVLQNAGVNLTPILAGVSVAGIAVAFAAQKTLENLFGGIMIITDEPVRVGDYCQFGSQAGTVEDIGLRSTRFRTIGRTVISVPNGELATMNLENYSVRDKILFNPTIGLRYETTPAQLRHVIAGVRRLLYSHPRVESNTFWVRFNKMDNSSLNVGVFAYVLTRDYNEFLAVQEDLLLRILDVVEASGSGLAFPSQTLYLGRDTGLDTQKAKQAEAEVAQWIANKQLPFPNYNPSQIAEFENTAEYPPPGSAQR